MSFQAMSWATEQDLPAMQKIVLLMMANRTNHETGLCYPSLELLANECGMDKRSVIRQVQKLEADGLVEVIREKNEKAVNFANKYIIRLDKKAQRKVREKPGTGGRQGSDRESLGVVTESHPGSDRESLGVVTESHPGSDRESPKPGNEPVIIEPVKEPINNSVELCAKSEKKTEQVKQVFDCWKNAMGHEKAVLDKKRSTAISNALAMGYTVDDLITAVMGCAKTPHNMGQNDRKQRYDGIELIFRSADQIDRFIGNFKTLPRIRPIGSVSSVQDPAKPNPEAVKAARERAHAAFLANRSKIVAL